MISVDQLRRYPFFSAVSEESLAQLAELAEPMEVPRGTEMFHEGEVAEDLFIIVRGEVDIQFQLGSGQLKAVDKLLDGDLLNWSALIEPYKLTATGTAARPTEMISFNARKLRELCDRDHELGFRVMSKVCEVLAKRLQAARVMLASKD